MRRFINLNKRLQVLRSPRQKATLEKNQRRRSQQLTPEQRASYRAAAAAYKLEIRQIPEFNAHVQKAKKPTRPEVRARAEHRRRLRYSDPAYSGVIKQRAREYWLQLDAGERKRRIAAQMERRRARMEMLRALHPEKYAAIRRAENQRNSRYSAKRYREDQNYRDAAIRRSIDKYKRDRADPEWCRRKLEYQRQWKADNPEKMAIHRERAKAKRRANRETPNPSKEISP